MKILVLGSKGQLGRCLNDQLDNTPHECIYTAREQIDIGDIETTKRQIMELSPDVVINAAAYTAVDKAEEEQEKAALINHLSVANIAHTCNQLDCWLVHVSTDYVFDGRSMVAYTEEDQTNPQSVYGETKLKGERAIQSSGCILASFKVLIRREGLPLDYLLMSVRFLQARQILSMPTGLQIKIIRGSFRCILLDSFKT